jgi:hypothetical protein
MAVNLEQLAEYLQLDVSVESFDEIKTQFNQRYIMAEPDAVKQNKELYSKLLGSLNGAFNTRLNAAAKKLGIELSKEELESWL